MAGSLKDRCSLLIIIFIFLLIFFKTPNLLISVKNNYFNRLGNKFKLLRIY